MRSSPKPDLIENGIPRPTLPRNLTDENVHQHHCLFLWQLQRGERAGLCAVTRHCPASLPVTFSLRSHILLIRSAALFNVANFFSCSSTSGILLVALGSISLCRSPLVQSVLPVLRAKYCSARRAKSSFTVSFLNGVVGETSSAFSCLVLSIAVAFL